MVLVSFHHAAPFVTAESRTQIASCAGTSLPGRIPWAGAMERTYDIFEVFPDGTVEWLESVSGHDAALARARDLAAKSTNELRVMHLPTNSIVAVLSRRESPSELPSKRRKRTERGRGHTRSFLRRSIYDGPVRSERTGTARTGCRAAG